MKCSNQTPPIVQKGDNSSPFPNPQMHIVLTTQMRTVWLQHVYWTRMLLISIANKLTDQSAVTDRLLQNPDDIAKIFSNYYASDVTDRIAQLLTEHLQIGAALITALRDKKSEEANRLSNQWRINANQMANAFSRINPHYRWRELQRMLYHHLDLTTQEVTMRLAGNYPADIKTFNMVEQQALEMADYFTSGLIRQFPQKFH